MKKFMGKNFLLKNDVAKILYHHYAAKLPIIDYHCHVSPKDIAENRKYENITELWLGGDHYKWRAMRFCGIDEEYITGNASAYEKFKAWCSCMPKLIGNPLYHWSHLELQRYFDYHGIIGADTCDEIWTLTNEKLADDSMSVRNLIQNSNVEILCTTDDPADSLEYHKQLAEDNSFTVTVLPAFRPDKAMNCDRRGFREYIAKLSKAAGITIATIEDLKAALSSRIAFFHELGCRTADHGFDDYVSYLVSTQGLHAAAIFEKALRTDGNEITANELSVYKTELMIFLGKRYKEHQWVMQIHFGVLRNANSEMFKKLGPDTGFDTISGINCTTSLARLLNRLNSENALPRTILYSINPTDNTALDALTGCFAKNDGGGLPYIQHGSAWWFNDNKVGMENQLTSLANTSSLGNFIGMLTDSRSFISYPRHEYFRRILCNLIGEWVENGEYPDDINTLADIVMDICYNNTKKIFGF